jgi:FkbM family methyltransferase
LQLVRFTINPKPLQHWYVMARKCCGWLLAATALHGCTKNSWPRTIWLPAGHKKQAVIMIRHRRATAVQRWSIIGGTSIISRTPGRKGLIWLFPIVLLAFGYASFTVFRSDEHTTVQEQVASHVAGITTLAVNSNATKINHLSLKDGDTVVPINCPSVDFQFGEGIFVNVTVNPGFKMNVHDPDQDKFISNDLATKGCFECKVLRAAMHALKQSKDAILLDLGSNLGLYSLSAASLGHKAVAFEPFRSNWERICRSILGSRSFEGMVTLFANAVTDKPALLGFRPIDLANFGATKVTHSKSNNYPNDAKEGENYVIGVPINDMDASFLPFDRPVVLKVDVEGHECRALEGAMAYLKKVEIVYMAIEWSLIRLRLCKNRKEIFDLMAKNGLRPYRDFGNGWELIEPVNWMSWQQEGSFPQRGLFDVAWSRQKPYDSPQ